MLNTDRTVIQMDRIRAAKIFEYEVIITSDMTNAEGNVTHYEYPRLFSVAKELFVMEHFPHLKDGRIVLAPYNSSYKYIKDFFPRDIIVTKVWIHEVDVEKSEIVFFAEFINKKNNEVQAIGIQIIKVVDINNWLHLKLAQQSKKKSKCRMQLKKLVKWEVVHNPVSKSAKAKFVDRFRYTMTFGQTNYMGLICHYEYANLFGFARELFGLKRIKGLRENAGKTFTLITNETNYFIIKEFTFGDEVEIRIWVESVQKTYFMLHAEMFNAKTGKLYAIGRHRIAYSDMQGNLGIPVSLKKLLNLIAGYSKLGRFAWIQSRFYHFFSCLL